MEAKSIDLGDCLDVGSEGEESAKMTPRGSVVKLDEGISRTRPGFLPCFFGRTK